jgi:hypothetical protein
MRLYEKSSGIDLNHLEIDNLKVCCDLGLAIKQEISNL